MPRSLVAALLLMAALVSVPTASSAAGGFCTLTGMDTTTWTGAGDGTTWDDPANWSGQVPDNTDDSRDTVYACIDDVVGGLVVMPATHTVEARVQAIDVAPGTTVLMEQGSKLFVYGDPATRPSVVREGAGIDLIASSYGGPGRTDLDGHLTWRTTDDGAATLVSAPCMLTVGEAPVPPSCDLRDPGLLAVGPTGVVDVDGIGVNLFDRFGIEVAGTLRLTNQGYVAADHGTHVDVVDGGVLDVRNDGGLYEGFTRDYPDQATLPPLAVTNAGLVLKRASDGASALTGSYAGDGVVRVRSGTLTLPAGTTRPAEVAAGDVYGAGTCVAFASYGCEAETSADDPASTLFRVPGSDGDGAKVRVRESGDTLASPVTAHATGLDATRRKPALLTFRYDSSITGNRHWHELRIFRQAAKGDPFRRVPDCDGRGLPPKRTQVACVDQQRSHDVAQGGVRDAVVVVRTRDTSRWVAR